MKFYQIASFSFLIGLLISQCSFDAKAQDDDDWNVRKYETKDFSKIYIEGGYRVYLQQGETASLKIKASDEDVFDYLIVDSDEESLRLRIRENHFNLDCITLYITFKELETIYIEGGVKLQTKGYLDLGDLYVHVEGGAKIELDIKAEEVKVEGEGGVLFELEGQANSLDAHISGAGHIDAGELKTKETTIKIEGVGTGSVYATDKLWASIAGVGKVKYRGNPEVHRNVDGIGTISHD